MIGWQSSRHFLNEWKTKPKPIVLGRTRLPALDAGYMYLLRQILIGSLRCLHLLWLARVITLGLVLQHSVENRSSRQKDPCILFAFGFRFPDILCSVETCYQLSRAVKNWKDYLTSCPEGFKPAKITSQYEQNVVSEFAPANPWIGKSCWKRLTSSKVTFY